MATHDPRVAAYIDRAADFARPILEHLRSLVHTACPDCEETLKWGAPTFMYRGKILASMAAFKQHATFGLWQGGQVLGTGTGKLGEAMGQFGRLTRVADLPPSRELAGYLHTGMQLIEGGVPRKPTAARVPKAPLPVPEDLAAALAAEPRAGATFEAFPPSARRDYIDWIVEAKRADTRQRRIVEATQWLAEGKRRNWKYENC